MRAAQTLATCAIIVCISGAVAFAHSNATGLVKIRMETMSAISREMKSIRAAIKSGASDKASIATAAQRIADHSKMVPDQFKIKDITTPSEAKAIIWDELDNFNSQARQMEDAARALTILATNGANSSDLTSAFQTLNKTCNTCHDRYAKD